MRNGVLGEKNIPSKGNSIFKFQEENVCRAFMKVHINSMGQKKNQTARKEGLKLGKSAAVRAVC